ncbi:hypothetical protein AAKU52_000270 [Pedobacter sp. CG_S7]|uniref:hypothetical protein n=1 Tax=Pedobacter sp. CG_S7 TaxID=3143930 RepID=UPI00339AD775
MKAKILLALLLLFICTTITFAQIIANDKSFKTIMVTAGKDVAFDKTIDYLQAKDFFIQSVDKQAGFIQAKVFVKHKKILSAKVGERRTMNFILRPTGNNINVMLNIYSEGYFFSGASNGHYYEDKGIIDDAAVYQDILSGLQKALDPY